jgi:hypothetical protein
VQPAARTPVTTRIAEILATSGRTEAEVVIGFTHRALAARVYETQNPTAAQTSAVRRAVAKLVAKGQAERGERMPAACLPWAQDLPPRDHIRRSKYGETYPAADPAGVPIFRTPTEEDREARRVWMESRGQARVRELEQAIERNR